MILKRAKSKAYKAIGAGARSYGRSAQSFTYRLLNTRTLRKVLSIVHQKPHT